MAEPLDLDEAFRASPETSAALERSRPGPVSLEEYARFLSQFDWPQERIAAIPLATGGRFTLD